MGTLLERLRAGGRWDPTPDEGIEGKVLERGMGEGKFGAFPTITIETDEGEAVVVEAKHTVLERELEDWDPQPGERIAIVFLGRPDGCDYFKYRVLVDRAKPSENGGGDFTAAA